MEAVARKGKLDFFDITERSIFVCLFKLDAGVQYLRSYVGAAPIASATLLFIRNYVRKPNQDPCLYMHIALLSFTLSLSCCCAAIIYSSSSTSLLSSSIVISNYFNFILFFVVVWGHIPSSYSYCEFGLGAYRTSWDNDEHIQLGAVVNLLQVGHFQQLLRCYCCEGKSTQQPYKFFNGC